ncbi:MAG: TonB-dependent receptor [Deltaproteobacteria bacterium]|nr:TonB-dependent receptor [Deltaproteobacteria bacterium]
MRRGLTAGLALAGLLGASGNARASDPPVEVWVEGAERAPTEPLRDPTAASFVLDARDLDRPGRTAADALASVPGLEVTRSGGGADLATASVRGTTSAQTPIHLAGIRLNDDLTGTVDLSSLPLWLLRRVEVDRGTAPASSDRPGMGGAIFFEPLLPSRTAARGLVGVGAFGQRELRGALALGDRKAGLLVAVRYDAARDDFEYTDDRGTRFDAADDVTARRLNADHAGLDAWALGRLEGDGYDLRALAHVFTRESGAPGLQVVPALTARARVDRGLGGVAGEHRTSRASIEWALDGLVTRYRLDDPRLELGRASVVENDGERSRQRVRVRFRGSEALEISAGIAQELQHLRVSEDGVGLDARRHVLHGDVEGRLEVARRATLVASASLDCHSTYAARGSACGIFAPTARLGAKVVLVPGLALFGNAGRYLREPTLGELYGISSALRGNDALLPETGYALDLGVVGRLRRGKLSGYAQLDGFARFASDLVAFKRSSFGAVRPYNVGSGRTLGVEAALGLRVGEWLHSSLALTWLDPRDTSEGRLVKADLVPFRSRLVAAPAIELRAPGYRPVSLDGASLTLRYLHRASRVADPAGLIVLPAQDLLEFEVEARFLRALVVRGRLTNLLDQRTVDLLGYPLPGRAAYATVESRW